MKVIMCHYRTNVGHTQTRLQPEVSMSVFKHK